MEAPRRPSGLGLDTLGSVTSKSLGRSNDLGVGAEVVEVLRVLMPEIGAELVARRTEVLGLHDAPQKAVLLGSVRALRASEVSKSYAKLVFNVKIPTEHSANLIKDLGLGNVSTHKKLQGFMQSDVGTAQVKTMAVEDEVFFSKNRIALVKMLVARVIGDAKNLRLRVVERNRLTETRTKKVAILAPVEVGNRKLSGRRASARRKDAVVERGCRCGLRRRGRSRSTQLNVGSDNTRQQRSRRW